MNFNIHLGFACKFKIQKFNEYGNITYDGPEFSNTMLKSGLLKLYSEINKVADAKNSTVAFNDIYKQLDAMAATPYVIREITEGEKIN